MRNFEVENYEIPQGVYKIYIKNSKKIIVVNKTLLKARLYEVYSNYIMENESEIFLETYERFVKKLYDRKLNEVEEICLKQRIMDYWVELFLVNISKLEVGKIAGDYKVRVKRIS